MNVRHTGTVALLLTVMAALGYANSYAAVSGSATVKSNADLAKVAEADQADQRTHLGDQSAITLRNAQRLARVKDMVAKGQLRSAQDYYNAALVLQHGADVTDQELAHQFAVRAVELDASLPNARWLVAATKDQWLISSGKPQQYGTLIQRKGGNGAYTLEPIDQNAVTDDERVAAGVLAYPLLLRMVQSMNADAHLK